MLFNLTRPRGNKIKRVNVNTLRLAADIVFYRKRLIFFYAKIKKRMRARGKNVNKTLFAFDIVCLRIIIYLYAEIIIIP